MRTIVPLPLALAAATSLLLGACADNTPGGQAVRARHEHFEELGAAMKAIDGQLKAAADGGDAAMVRAAVKTVGAACKNCHDAFKAD